MSAGDMSKKWRSVAAKYAAKGDQDLQEFRDAYLRWSTDDRFRFKEALVLVTEANDIFGRLPTSFFRSHVEMQCGRELCQRRRRLRPRRCYFRERLVNRLFEAHSRAAIPISAMPWRSPLKVSSGLRLRPLRSIKPTTTFNHI